MQNQSSTKHVIIISILLLVVALEGVIIFMISTIGTNVFVNYERFGVPATDEIQREKEATSVAESQWDLTFDLPEDWVMARPYVIQDTGATPTTADHQVVTDVNGSMAEIVLQNSIYPVLISSGWAPNDYDENLYAPSGSTVIQVARIEVSELPSTAVAMGDGWYKNESCDFETYPECGIGGLNQFEYYFSADGNLYQFVTYGPDEQSKEIILSAQPTE